MLSAPGAGPSSEGTWLAGKYELVGLAGTGGMAEIYRAWAHGTAGFRRPVAVKRMLGEFVDDPEYVAMFVEEARVGSMLDHPNLVHVHDFGVDPSGRYFLVMEWVDGLSLNDILYAHQLAARPTPWPVMTAIAIETLKALSAAHERRDDDGRPAPVFHRDVTPSNILVTRSGVAKLMDFGLSRAMDRARITQPHILKGKLSYAAPELVDGHDPTVATDLFTLGIVLHEALTAEKLFRADSPLDLLRAIKQADVPRVSTVRPELPEPLADAVARALARDPAARFSSARSMARTLANVLRVTPQSTSAEVVARAVADAEVWLQGRRAVETVD